MSKVLQNAPREHSAILSTCIVLHNAQREHSAILWTCIKLPSLFKTFILSGFEWSLKTSFTACCIPWMYSLCLFHLAVPWQLHVLRRVVLWFYVWELQKAQQAVVLSWIFLDSNHYWAGRVFGFVFVFYLGEKEGFIISSSGLQHSTDGATA